MEDALDVLKAAGFHNVAEERLADPYSYAFDAQFGALDHVFAAASLNGQVTGVTEWHINADEADALDYNLDFGRSPAIFDAAALVRESDHDPVLVGLALGGRPVAQDGILNTVEDTTAFGALVADDIDSPGLSYSLVVTSNAHGTVTITNPGTGAFSYTPATHFSGTASFTFQAGDGVLVSNTATVSILVQAAADPPSLDVVAASGVTGTACGILDFGGGDGRGVSDRPDVARDLNNLAQLLEATNRLGEVDPLMLRGVQILVEFQHRTGHEHPNLRVVRANHGAMAQALGRAPGQDEPPAGTRTGPLAAFRKAAPGHGTESE